MSMFTESDFVRGEAAETIYREFGYNPIAKCTDDCVVEVGQKYSQLWCVSDPGWLIVITDDGNTRRQLILRENGRGIIFREDSRGTGVHKKTVLEGDGKVRCFTYGGEERLMGEVQWLHLMQTQIAEKRTKLTSLSSLVVPLLWPLLFPKKPSIGTHIYRSKIING